MKAPWLKIARHPYEEPHHLNLWISASNGRLESSLEYYCNAEDLGDLGKKLSGFSGKRSEEVVYDLGSERPEDNFAFFFSMRAKALDSLGHCALRVRMSNNRADPETEVSEFFIKADVADLNRLGQLLQEFGQLRHRVLDWRVQDGMLFKDEAEAAANHPL